MEKSKKKISKKKAALIIQKYARGWLTRFYYKGLRKIADNQGKSLNQFVKNYIYHLTEIMSRHDVRKEIDINLFEIYDYAAKRVKYEAHFDAFAIDGHLTYGEMAAYFNGLGLKPTQVEIKLAIQKLLFEEEEDYKKFHIGKQDVVDVALHIYTPKGTKLKNTRVSTWLFPVVDDDNALLLSDQLPKKQLVMKYERAASIVTSSIREWKENPVAGRSGEMTRSDQMFHAIRNGQALFTGYQTWKQLTSSSTGRPKTSTGASKKSASGSASGRRSKSAKPTTKKKELKKKRKK